MCINPNGEIPFLWFQNGCWAYHKPFFYLPDLCNHKNILRCYSDFRHTMLKCLVYSRHNQQSLQFSLTTEQKTSTEYLFLNFEWTRNQILKLINEFQKKWKNCELYYQPEKLGKQFGYADKKWIPYVVILWEWERSEWIYKIKNMQTGGEETVKL